MVGCPKCGNGIGTIWWVYSFVENLAWSTFAALFFILILMLWVGAYFLVLAVLIAIVLSVCLVAALLPIKKNLKGEKR